MHDDNFHQSMQNGQVAISLNLVWNFGHGKLIWCCYISHTSTMCECWCHFEWCTPVEFSTFIKDFEMLFMSNFWHEWKENSKRKRCVAAGCLMPERKAADIILICYLNSMAGIKSSHFHVILICGIFSWIGKTKHKSDLCVMTFVIIHTKNCQKFRETKLTWFQPYS